MEGRNIEYPEKDEELSLAIQLLCGENKLSRWWSSDYKQNLCGWFAMAQWGNLAVLWLYLFPR